MSLILFCLPCTRRGIALAYLGGPIYAIGGLDDRACFNTVERYDPSSDTWSSVQPMNYVRGGVAVAELKVSIFETVLFCKWLKHYLREITFIIILKQ